MKYYAGIGSRETPKDICEEMTYFAQELSKLGYTLLSGGADGADHAFEIGAKDKLIFLPWDGFCNKVSNGKDYLVPSYNENLVRKYHPKFDSLTAGGKKLMSRNSYQVLNQTLKDPVEFVLCWTKDGKASGGTGQALRIAKDFNVPVYNLKVTDFKVALNMMRFI